jgi:hypothetical protein
MPGSLSLPPAPVGFLLGLLFGPEDQAIQYLRYVGLSPNYTSWQPRRPKSSFPAGTVINTAGFLEPNTVFNKKIIKEA